MVEIDSANWRTVCALQVHPHQSDFVASVSHYLNLCAYGDLGWSPFAIMSGPQIVGFVMWGIDDDDGSFWIGGLLVDAEFQQQGYGRAAMKNLLKMAADRGDSAVALSYQPANPARKLYLDLGFTETGEELGDEIIARRFV